jgi:flagellar basal body-associated protein FliL
VEQKKSLTIIYRLLLILNGSLITLLTVGTIYAFARSSGKEPLLRTGKINETETSVEIHKTQYDGIRVFSGIGRLRILLSNSSTMILSIAFPYSAGDFAFTEELASKIGDFKSITSGFFSSLPADKLVNIDEDAVKLELLNRFNAILRLGRIEALYFDDLIILNTSESTTSP